MFVILLRVYLHQTLTRFPSGQSRGEGRGRTKTDERGMCQDGRKRGLSRGVAVKGEDCEEERQRERERRKKDVVDELKRKKSEGFREWRRGKGRDVMGEYMGL